MKRFSELQTTKKGDIGESIIKQMLEAKGYIIMQPTTNAPHPFDMVAVKNKSEFLLVEVKTKARMQRRKETGINQANFKYYYEACQKHNFRLFLVFVDEHPAEKRIYGNYLDVLEEQVIINGVKYPYVEKLKGGYVRFYPLSKMITLSNLTPEQVQILRENTKRNYNY